jgi:hypothetical protein
MRYHIKNLAILVEGNVSGAQKPFSTNCPEVNQLASSGPVSKLAAHGYGKILGLIASQEII